MSTSERGRWRGAAFGLELEGDFPAPGLEGRAGRSATRRAELTRVEHGLLAAGDAESVLDVDLAGTPFRIYRGRRGGYLLDHGFFGRFEVAPGGRSIRCAPAARQPDWSWQRFLAAQPLPLAALLAGLECLHASAVAVAGRGLLLLGPSGAGKTSVALHIARHEQGLITDDVSAIELRGGVAVVHAGARTANVDPSELAHVGSAVTTLGAQDGESRVLTESIQADGGPWPVGAVYVLSRRAGVSDLEIRPPDRSPAAILLGATFNSFHREQARLRTQLDIVANLAERAPIREVRMPLTLDARSAAAAISAAVAAGAAP